MQYTTINRTISIYQIYNRITNKSYIGSAFNVTSRWKQHIAKLNNGIHNKLLQEAWDNTTIDSWDFRILEEGIILNKRIEKEQYWFNVMGGEYNGTDKIYCMNHRNNYIRRVLLMIANGDTYRKISSELGVSIGYISNVKQKYQL